jgi:hypothetical protein
MSTTPKTDAAWRSSHKAARYLHGIHDPASYWSDLACDMRDLARKQEAHIAEIEARNEQLRDALDCLLGGLMPSEHWSRGLKAAFEDDIQKAREALGK